MGGFEGGDEGGYWDIDTLPSLMDKQNENSSKNRKRSKSSINRSDAGYSIKAYSTVKDVYDTISFIACECKTLTIEGCDDIALEANDIYKAYKALIDFTDDVDITEFFYTHKVVVTKKTSSQSDPISTSSYAAAFILLVKDVCNLVLSNDELAKIGSGVNADVPAFIYNSSSNI